MPGLQGSFRNVEIPLASAELLLGRSKLESPGRLRKGDPGSPRGSCALTSLPHTLSFKSRLELGVHPASYMDVSVCRGRRRRKRPSAPGVSIFGSSLGAWLGQAPPPRYTGFYSWAYEKVMH